jgi:hypothetical protein
MNGSPDSRDLGAFTSAEAERKYTAAYDDVLAQWPVPFTQVTVSTPFGETHVIVSGPEGGARVVLLRATGMSSTVWLPNIGEVSQGHRTFAVDIVNEPGPDSAGPPSAQSRRLCHLALGGARGTRHATR